MEYRLSNVKISIGVFLHRLATFEKKYFKT